MTFREMVLDPDYDFSGLFKNKFEQMMANAMHNIGIHNREDLYLYYIDNDLREFVGTHSYSYLLDMIDNDEFNVYNLSVHEICGYYSAKYKVSYETVWEDLYRDFTKIYGKDVDIQIVIATILAKFNDYARILEGYDYGL